MQYGCALVSLLREVVFSDPNLSPLYMLKSNLAAEFYGICLRPAYAPKLGLVFPMTHYGEQFVAIPLTLPVVWKNSPPLFCTVTETISNMDNASLRQRTCAHPQKLNSRAEAITKAPAPAQRPDLASLQR